MQHENPLRVYRYLRWTAAMAVFIAFDIANAQSGGRATAAPAASPTPRAKIPRHGAVYVDVITDKTGAVARLDFLNNVPAEVQEWMRSKTLGRHFGVPNHTYRRHVEYDLPDAPRK